MKIQPIHYAHLKQQIDALLASHNANGELIQAYEQGRIPRADKVKDLQRRFCFDLLHAAGLTPYVCDNLYSYLHDAHLYTALKSICPPVVRNY